MLIMTNIMNQGEKHIACVLLVDTSGSMGGRPIAELNEGLRAFGEALQEDTKAAGCADICVISFNSTVETVVPFCSAEEYVVPVLNAGGLTAMNEAIITGLDLIEARKQEYKSIGVDYYKPWMFLLTDGEPTDGEYASDAKDRLQEALNLKKINFFPMGIGEEANTALLKAYTKDGNGAVLKAEKNHFKEAFVWLSSSLTVISNSRPDQIDASIPTPSTISDWIIEL